jgi:heme/copper-type cytochrome/quinol oxidase subunit 2
MFKGSKGLKPENNCFYLDVPRNPLLCDGSHIHMNRNVWLIFFSFLLLAAGCQNKSNSGAERIKVVMKKYTIEPAVIHVKAGQTTELEVSTADVQHGFDVPELGIKEPVRPGSPAVITLKSPAKGEYKVVCGIICGPHHDDMQAKLVVE